ncbi:MAG TPA: GNAT family N-acetyltransferase [Rhizomicrobium sp.]|nr:GNAT family N-acetyltransferase [Rhizomicrobium sp.]
MTARLMTSAADIGAARWNALANPAGVAQPHPFTTFEFFDALEASGSATADTGWQPCHLIIDDPPPPHGGGGSLGIMPLYLKSHSYGEYVFDHAWAEALERAGGDYYPKLQCAVPFTPVTGPRLLAADDEARPALLRTAAGVVRQLKASSLHITFPTQAEWKLAGDAGYLLRTGQQFHWENRGYDSFDQFLGELSSSKRKNLRKERASVREAGITFDWLTGADITEAHWDRFFDFYMDTGGRKWGTPYLTREFFSRLGDGLAHQTLLIMAKRDGDYIAGALNLFGEGVLFGRNWGAADYVPFLHFETCYYQAIDFAIARGLKRVEAGAQGEHKLLRGYMPVPTYSAHVIAHPGLARAVDQFLAAERAVMAENIAELSAHGPFRKSDGGNDGL